MTKIVPTIGQLADLAFAWLAVKHVKSNGIVIASDGTLRGMGAGSRTGSCRWPWRRRRRASWRAARSSPRMPLLFPDGLEAAAAAGVVAVAQPGGSVNDEKVIAAADAAGLAMVLHGGAALQALTSNEWRS